MGETSCRSSAAIVDREIEGTTCLELAIRSLGAFQTFARRRRHTRPWLGVRGEGARNRNLSTALRPARAIAGENGQGEPLKRGEGNRKTGALTIRRRHGIVLPPHSDPANAPSSKGCRGRGRAATRDRPITGGFATRQKQTVCKNTPNTPDRSSNSVKPSETPN